MDRATGHYSAVKLPDAWFIACESKSLGKRPLGIVLQETPLVLFRDGAGKASALLDRCPHRNVPLSAGEVVEGQLQCGYHGWRFDGGGVCRAIPGLVGEPGTRGRNAVSYATVEQDGFVWVYSTPDAQPKSAPYKFPHLGEAGYSTVKRAFTVDSTMHAMIENTLDVPHTAFLHGGLFRTSKKRLDIEVVVRRDPAQAEAEFIGEPRPPGLVGKILAPGGGVVTHFDRFVLPSIAQVEYRLGPKSHMLTTSALTPISDFVTRVWAVVTFRLPVPSFLVRPFLQPVALRIFKQDAKMLKLQTESVQRFGGEQYASTEIDVLGPHVWLLLKNASRGAEAPPVDRLEQRVTMRV